jgi:Cu(I)/Ag(I) efflux system membrane fusion protein/cobalt-zinc-cadmium efflux system membrane fusion protein
VKRPLLLFVTIGVLLLVVGAGIYLLRTRRLPTFFTSPQPAGAAAMSDKPASPSADTAVAPSATPRGDVTIDPRRQQLIGVRTVPVTRESIGQAVRAVGAVRYNETRLTDVNVKVEGWIRELYVNATGQPIQKGQPLFTLYSPDLLSTQQEYLLALKTRDQLQQSTIPDARSRADDLVASARQRLALWDLPADALGALEEKRQAIEAVVVRSPASGFVIEKQAITGLHVMPGQNLYKVADLSTVWVEADVYETELSGVRAGLTATVTVDAYPGERFSGRVTYLYPYLDEKTRTNKVRLELTNSGGRLKPGMYANVELKVGTGTGLIVPTNAVLDSGTEQIVFVAQGEGRFEPRTVKIGRRLGDTTQILEGVKEGEQVATGATFFLDSESQLRASLQGYEAAPTQGGGRAVAAQLDIAFHTLPDPPKIGDNQFEAVIKDATGKPIDDADVSVQLFMPAMPTMNMPAMRNETKLSPAGGGVYRGSGQVMMAGRWDATVTVVRGGQRLGTKQLPVVAR